MANKSIEEMSDDEIESQLSNTRLKITKKEPLIRELSARYADKIIGNTKPDQYFRNIDNNKVDVLIVKRNNPPSTKAISPEITRNIILIVGILLIIAVCLGGCILFIIGLWIGI